MQSTKKLFLLAIAMTLVVAYAVAAPAPQAGQISELQMVPSSKR